MATFTITIYDPQGPAFGAARTRSGPFAATRQQLREHYERNQWHFTHTSRLPAPDQHIGADHYGKFDMIAVIAWNDDREANNK